MSYICVKWSYSKDIKSLNLNKCERAVLTALCFAYYDGLDERRIVKGAPDCYPSRERLAEMTGWGVSSIDAAKASLRKKGLVTWIKGGCGRKRRSNAYTLNCPELLEKLNKTRKRPVKFLTDEQKLQIARLPPCAEEPAALPPIDPKRYGYSIIDLHAVLIRFTGDSERVRSRFFKEFVNVYAQPNKEGLLDIDLDFELLDESIRRFEEMRERGVRVTDWLAYMLASFRKVLEDADNRLEALD